MRKANADLMKKVSKSKPVNPVATYRISTFSFPTAITDRVRTPRLVFMSPSIAAKQNLINEAKFALDGLTTFYRVFNQPRGIQERSFATAGPDQLQARHRNGRPRDRHWNRQGGNTGEIYSLRILRGER